MAWCLLGLGSNLGDRREHLAEAMRLLAQSGGLQVVAKSRLYESHAVGGPAAQPKYLNAVVLVDTSLQPAQLLTLVQEIEIAAGRDRRVRWGPRPLDIDLLLYEDLVINKPELTLPHPRMAFRRFVLEPAAEIAPTLRHPVFGLTVFQLLEHLDESAPYLALTGPPGCGKSALARQIGHRRTLKIISGPGGVFADSPPERKALPLRAPSKRRLLRRLLDREGRILFRRSQVLATHLGRWKWSEVRGVRLITDFWPWESAAFLRALRHWVRRWPPRVQALVAAAGEQFREMLADYIPPPKLVVHLDFSGHTLLAPPAQEQPARWDELIGPPPAKRLRHLSLALRKEIGQPYRGPWLRLVDASQEDAAAEIQAAIAAMEAQPTPLRETLS